MREIVLDTETTGLEARGGDRIFEIGCVELINHMPTGETYHVYLNPDRALSSASIEITGIRDEQLVDKPRFADVATEFAAFLGDAHLVIHNASFDVGFLDMEFERVGRPRISQDRVVDTLAMAKKRFPGAQANLDALCRRFGVDNSGRDKHGALLDAELLAEVYLELRGGRQPGFELAAMGRRRQSGGAESGSRREGLRRTQRSRLTEAEAAAHAAFVADLGGDVLWRQTGLVEGLGPEAEADAKKS